jgi:hypothetical protein
MVYGAARILACVLGEDWLGDWCDRYLGARPASVLSRSGHLSEVIAAELADGRRVVVKARPSAPHPARPPSRRWHHHHHGTAGIMRGHSCGRTSTTRAATSTTFPGLHGLMTPPAVSGTG